MQIRIRRLNYRMCTKKFITRGCPLPEIFKHETEMVSVEEMPEESEAVEFVIRVSVIQLL